MDKISCEHNVPGQAVLPEMEEEMGYAAIVLKPFQERFCWEYVLYGENGSAAYRKVKPSVKESTARVEASKLLTNPDVVERIKQIRAELKRRYRVTADDVLEYHGKVLKIDRNEFVEVDKQGRISMRSLRELSDEAASIVDIDFTADKDGNVIPVVSVPDRRGASVEISKILGLVKEKRELSGPDGGPIETEAVVTFYLPENGRD